MPQSSMPESEAGDSALFPFNLRRNGCRALASRLGTVEYKQLSDDIRATGSVDIDERLVSYVQVRFPGYIRKVFANATYQYVRKGEPLFTIYSPDLVATQQEYLLARQNQKAVAAEHCRWCRRRSGVVVCSGRAATGAVGSSRKRNREAERHRQANHRPHD